MALPHEKKVCYPHGWVGEGECPRCLEQQAQDATDWFKLTTDERVEALRRATFGGKFPRKGRDY